MDDYISRQAAIKALCAMRCGCKPEECALTLEEDGTEECADARFLMSIPAADVPDRKVGKWHRREKLRGNLDGDHDWQYECTECGFIDIHSDKVDVPFCWHCGAKMEGWL